MFDDVPLGDCRFFADLVVRVSTATLSKLSDPLHP